MAGSGIYDREVFSDKKTRVVRVLDGIEHPALGGADGSGAIAGKFAGLTQLVGLGDHDRHVSTGSLPQGLTASTFPEQNVGLIADLQEHVFPLIGGLSPIGGRLYERFSAPCLDLGKGWHHLDQPGSHGGHLGRCGLFVGAIPSSTGHYGEGR